MRLETHLASNMLLESKSEAVIKGACFGCTEGLQLTSELWDNSEAKAQIYASVLCKQSLSRPIRRPPPIRRRYCLISSNMEIAKQKLRSSCKHTKYSSSCAFRLEL